MNKIFSERVIRTLFYLFIATFFFLYLRGLDFSSIEGLNLDWRYLSIASILALTFRYWGVLVWKSILKNLGVEKLPRFVILAYVYAQSWLARYIPGTLPWIASKIYLASRHGISKSKLTASSLLEAGMQIVAIATVSMILLIFDPRFDLVAPAVKYTAILIALIFTSFLYPPVFNRAAAFAYKILRREESPEIAINNQAVGKSFSLYAAGAFITGASYYLLTVSIYPEIAGEHFFYLIGAFNLAGVIGMATPFVPSGLGVREGAQLLLVGAVMPAEIAFTVTLISRLWSVVIDVVFYLVSRLLYRINLSNNQRKSKLLHH